MQSNDQQGERQHKGSKKKGPKQIRRRRQHKSLDFLTESDTHNLFGERIHVSLSPNSEPFTGVFDIHDSSGEAPGGDGNPGQSAEAVEGVAYQSLSSASENARRWGAPASIGMSQGPGGNSSAINLDQEFTRRLSNQARSPPLPYPASNTVQSQGTGTQFFDYPAHENESFEGIPSGNFVGVPDMLYQYSMGPMQGGHQAGPTLQSRGPNSPEYVFSSYNGVANAYPESLQTSEWDSVTFADLTDNATSMPSYHLEPGAANFGCPYTRTQLQHSATYHVLGPDRTHQAGYVPQDLDFGGPLDHRYPQYPASWHGTSGHARSQAYQGSYLAAPGSLPVSQQTRAQMGMPSAEWQYYAAQR